MAIMGVFSYNNGDIRVKEMMRMATLWQKEYTVDALIHAYTVGRDFELDLDLVRPDCAASIAHVRMLKQIGILDDREAADLEETLMKALVMSEEGSFTITREDEDCHTALEGFLVSQLGDTGKKVHTGRSRNDQVQTALRLWMRDMLHQTIEAGWSLVERIHLFSHRHMRTPMPGRTHMQIAMPSSVGLWAGAYGEELLDEIAHLFAVLEIIDQCPLGSAASYGVPLPLDREMTSRLLGFSRVQNNVLYANNCRGKFEAVTVDALEYIALTLSKIAQDLMLFSLPEFGYFSLPDELCTGSSIMPQKKNPDGLELTRSKAALVAGYAASIKNVIRSLPSGYNRDFQDTKEPFMQASRTVFLMIKVMDLTFSKLQVHEDALEKAFTPEIYATDAAISMARSGMSFRDAYRKTGLDKDTWMLKDPRKALEERTSQGSPGNLRLDIMEKELDRLKAYGRGYTAPAGEALKKLLGREVRFFSA